MIPTSISTAESAKLVQLSKDKVVLEIGSWLGYSAVLMAAQAKRVYTVDWHLGDETTGYGNTTHQFFDNVLEQGFKIIALVGRTQDILPVLAPCFDFVFIDGSHKAENVCFDLMWAKRLCPSGRIALHDYKKYPGVERALQNDDILEVVDTLAII